MARGGRAGGGGGKGPKPQFTRVIPKFLQQYETMLNGPKPGREGGEERHGGGGGEFVDGSVAVGGGGSSSSSGMPGKGKGNRDDQAQGGGSRGGGGGRGGAGAFDDYDEEEVAALEAYMNTHPSKEEDKLALRKRAKELSASIGTGQGGEPKGGDRSGWRGVVSGPTGEGGEGSSKLIPPEAPLEYTDASGKLKFNKRPAGGVGRESTGGVSGSKRGGKKAKRAKLAKLNNAKLLSFGDYEES